MKLEQLIQDSDWSERDKLINLGFISRAKEMAFTKNEMKNFYEFLKQYYE